MHGKQIIDANQCIHIAAACIINKSDVKDFEAQQQNLTLHQQPVHMHAPPERSLKPC